MPKILLNILAAMAIFLPISALAQLTWGTGGVGVTGTWNSSNTNWYNGISNVAWISGGTGTFTGATTGSYTINISGTQTVSELDFKIGNYNVILNGGTLTSTGGLILNIPATSATIPFSFGIPSINSQITGGPLTVETGGNVWDDFSTFELTGANTYTGGTTIGSQVGILLLGSTAKLGTGVVTDNGALEYAQGTTFVEKNLITGTGSVGQDAGVLTLDAANTYSGGTVIFGNGTTIVSHSTVLSTVGGTTTIASGSFGTGLIKIGSSISLVNTILDNNTAITLANSLEINGTVVFGNPGLGGGSLTFDGTTLTAPATVTLDGQASQIDVVDSTMTIADNITGTQTELEVTGRGTLALTGNNTGISSLIILGTLAINSNNALGGANVSFRSGGMLKYISSASGTISQTIAILTGSATIYNSGGATLTVASTLTKNDTDLILNSGGAGLINVTGLITSPDATGAFDSDVFITNGSSEYSHANNYSGATRIFGNGELINGVDNAVPISSVIYLGSSTTTASDPTYENGNFTNTYELNGFNQSISGLVNTTTNGSGGTDTNSVIGGSSILSTLTLTGTATLGAGTFGSNSVTDGNNLAISFNPGAGNTVSLTGSNTYAGGTVIVSGTLVVTNPDGSATGTGSVTLNNGATLAGTGSINSTTNNLAGIIQGGNPGLTTSGSLTLTSSGTTTFASTANLVFNLAATGFSNQLNVSNSAVLFSGSTLTLNLVDSSTADYANGLQFILIAADGDANQFSGITFDGNNHITGLNLALTGTATNGQQDSVYYANSFLALENGNIVVEIQAVPEPETWALFLGGLVFLAFWKRRQSVFRIIKLLN